MRIQQKNKKGIAIIAIIGVVVVLLVASAVGYALKVGPFAVQSGTSQNTEPASEEEKKQSIDAKKRAIENGSKTQIGSDPAPEPQSIPGTTKSSVLVDIPSALQNGASLHVSTLIQTVTATGRCTLTLTMGQQTPYSMSTDVQALSSASTCKGFDIPVSQLGPGTWTATVDFSSDTLQGTATKQVVVK